MRSTQTNHGASLRSRDSPPETPLSANKRVSFTTGNNEVHVLSAIAKSKRHSYDAYAQPTMHSSSDTRRLQRIASTAPFRRATISSPHTDDQISPLSIRTNKNKKGIERFPSHVIQMYRQIFNQIDETGQDKISFNQLQSALSTLSRDKIIRVMQRGDMDQDGFLNFEEFVEVMTNPDTDLGESGNISSLPLELVREYRKLFKHMIEIRPTPGPEGLQLEDLVRGLGISVGRSKELFRQARVGPEGLCFEAFVELVTNDATDLSDDKPPPAPTISIVNETPPLKHRSKGLHLPQTTADPNTTRTQPQVPLLAQQRPPLFGTPPPPPPRSPPGSPTQNSVRSPIRSPIRSPTQPSPHSPTHAPVHSSNYSPTHSAHPVAYNSPLSTALRAPPPPPLPPPSPQRALVPHSTNSTIDRELDFGDFANDDTDDNRDCATQRWETASAQLSDDELRRPSILHNDRRVSMDEVNLLLDRSALWVQNVQNAIRQKKEAVALARRKSRELREVADSTEERYLKMSIPADLIPEFKEVFNDIDSDHKGFVSADDIAKAFGIALQSARDMMKKQKEDSGLYSSQSDSLTFTEFVDLVNDKPFEDAQQHQQQQRIIESGFFEETRPTLEQLHAKIDHIKTMSQKLSDSLVYMLHPDQQTIPLAHN